MKMEVYSWEWGFIAGKVMGFGGCSGFFKGQV